MADSVQTAPNGVTITPANFDQTLTYSGGNCTKISVTVNGIVYSQNFTYDGSGNCTFISRWTAE